MRLPGAPTYWSRFAPGGAPARSRTQGIAWMSQWRPTHTKLRYVSEHIIAFRHDASLDPGYEVFEGAVANCAVDRTMPRPANGALHQ